MRRCCPALAIMALSIISTWTSAEVTKFLKPIRAEHSAIRALNVEMEALARSPDPDKIRDLGMRLGKRAESFRKVTRDFCGAETRRGLAEEVLMLHDGLATLLAMEQTYDGLVSGRRTSVTPEEQEALASEVRAFAGEELRKETEKQLRSQGLLETLGERAFNEAVDTATAKAEAEALIFRRVDRRVKAFLALGMGGPDVLRTVLRERARYIVLRHVGKMLVRITSNTLIIEWAAGVLLRWLGPKLKELFRGRGNLEFRTERSVGTLEEARRRLNELPPDAKISGVVAALDSAQETIGATKYLFGDLERAGDGQLLAQVGDARGNLQRTMSITNKRFLLHRQRYAQDCEKAEGELTRLIAELGSGTPDAGDIEFIEFPPRYLVHLTETMTTGGPQKQDVWILHGDKPDEKGVVLTADGMGGVFVNKADQSHGPFTNSHQLCPVLKQLGLDGIWRGQRYISCKPRQ